MNMNHDFETPSRLRLERNAWDSFLDSYTLELKLDPSKSPGCTNERISDFLDHVDQARETLLRTPAPDLDAVIEKLKAAWLDDRDVQPWEQAMILSDLRKLSRRPGIDAVPVEPVEQRRVTRRDTAAALGAHKLNGVAMSDEPCDLAAQLLAGIHAWASVMGSGYQDTVDNRKHSLDTEFAGLNPQVKAAAMESLCLQAHLADYFTTAD